MSRPPERLDSLLRRSYPRVAVPLAAALLVALGGELAVQWQFRQIVDRIEPMATANAEILQALTDAETGARGFQLTGQRTFLEPYQRGLRLYPAAAGRARAAAGGDRTAADLLAAQERAAEDWITRLGGPAAAGRTPDQVAGKRMFDRIRQTNQSVARHAEDRRETARQQVRRTLWLTLLLAGVCTLLALAYGVRTARRVTRSVTEPVADLSGTLGRLADGELTARARGSGPAELRMVADCVNNLGEQLQRVRERDAEQRRRDELLRSVEQAVRRQSEPLEVLSAAARVLGPGLGVDRVYVRLAEDGRSGAAVGIWPPHDPPPAALPGLVPWTPGSEPAAVHAVRDVDAEAEMPEDWRAYVLSMGVRAYLYAPLRVGEQLLGYLTIQSRTPRDWDAEDLTLAGRAGRELALTLGQVRAANKQREAVARLTALDRIREAFVSTVSHELRTPLTSIAGYLEILLDGTAGPLSSRQKQMLGVVERNTVRLRALIDDLLTLSSVDAGRLEVARAPLDLREVAEAAVTAMRPVADAGGLTLISLLPPDPLPVQGDQAGLERVVLNLLSNAVKYTPARGTVTVTGWTDEHGVAVSVADTGMGIPAGDQQQLFSRFFRASNARASSLPGTGLGLALVHELMRRQDGTVELSSTEGVGTTVTLRLPLHRRQNADGQVGVRSVGAAPAR